MKTSHVTNQNFNCTAPALIIILMLTLCFVITSCGTSTKQFSSDHFPNKKITKIYNQKRVDALVKLKTLRKCYAYQ